MVFLTLLFSVACDGFLSRFNKSGFFHRSRLKWLNSPVKATEYKRERELDNSEPVLIKDRQPEKDNKDEEVTGCFCIHEISAGSAF